MLMHRMASVMEATVNNFTSEQREDQRQQELQSSGETESEASGTVIVTDV